MKILKKHIVLLFTAIISSLFAVQPAFAQAQAVVHQNGKIALVGVLENPEKQFPIFFNIKLYLNTKNQ